MTVIIEKTKICPKCHKKSELTLYPVVNVTLNPELKEQVTSCAAFTSICPFCKFKAYIFYDLLYHDMKAGVIINYLENDSQINQAIKRFKEMKALDKEGMIKDDDQFRIVTTVKHLVEKIHISEAGLDDKVVEMMKYIMRQNDKEIKTTDDIVFDKMGDAQYRIIVVKDKNMGSYVEFDQNYYNYLAKLFNDELSDAYIIDSQWAKKEVARILG